MIITSEYFKLKRKFKWKFPTVQNSYLQKRIKSRSSCATVILLPFQLLLPSKKQWPVSTCNNFAAVLFTKSLVFRTNNFDFFQGSVTKEQLQHSFPNVCEPVWPAQNSNWFCYNQVFPSNSFPVKRLRYSTSVSGLHRYKKPWEQGCELVPFWRPTILLKRDLNTGVSLLML